MKTQLPAPTIQLSVIIERSVTMEVTQEQANIIHDERHPLWAETVATLKQQLRAKMESDGDDSEPDETLTLLTLEDPLNDCSITF